MKNTFAVKNKRIKFLKNLLESKNKIIKDQSDMIDIKDRANHILEIEAIRLKDELSSEIAVKGMYKSDSKAYREINDKYYETILLSESRCNKKSLHIKILYAVLIVSISLLFWSIK